ncbi:MAG: hypothetical protein IJ277_02260 [Bacteroidaceae bacterium]|nr:hypothetical protein [Bacteroidaceae bacterium]
MITKGSLRTLHSSTACLLKIIIPFLVMVTLPILSPIFRPGRVMENVPSMLSLSTPLGDDVLFTYTRPMGVRFSLPL